MARARIFAACQGSPVLSGCSFKICRTTWWTRQWKRLRNDMNLESELTLKLEKNEVETSDVASKFAKKNAEQGTIGILKRTYDWLCGYNVTEEAEDEVESEERMRMITSIKQTKQEKIILNVFLIIILSIGVFILAYFTTPA